MKETQGHGLFCVKVHRDLCWVGCYDGHLFVFDMNTFEKKDYKKLQQGIYDIAVWTDEAGSKNGVPEEYLIFGQHYGLIDIVKVDGTRKMLSINLPKVNTIFSIILTSHRAEVCFCSYNGLYFAKIKKDLSKNTLTMDLNLQEIYFFDKYVSRGVEYSPDKFVVCVQDDV